MRSMVEGGRGIEPAYLRLISANSRALSTTPLRVAVPLPVQGRSE